MVEEIIKNVYRIPVPLAGNPLKELNSYLIKGDDRELLIDTGFRTDACAAALRAGLDEIGSVDEIRDVYCTHLHADHTGNSDRFVGGGRHVYMAGSEVEYSIKAQELPYMDFQKRFLVEGLTEEMIHELNMKSPSSAYVMPGWRRPFVRRAQNGDIFKVGDYELRIISVPGHTPGNTMLWDEKDKVMFTGDHILFDITPNITFFNKTENILGKYLDSLRLSDTFPVELALPGHRQTGDYHARIQSLLEHHSRRINEAYKVVCEHPGLMASEIAGKMTWKIRSSTWEDFPLVQKRFAVGEAISHLDYLRDEGKVRREPGLTGRWIYFAV